jgi:hypothetical protein
VSQQLSNEEFLQHFGVLGMHWGVHRSSKGNASSGSKKTKEDSYSEDYKKKVSLKKKKPSQMTNAELKTLNERLQLEKQYKDLTRSETTAGKKFVADILSNAAKQTASTYVAKYMGKGVEKIIKKTAK